MGDDSNPPKTITRRLRRAAVVVIGLLAVSGALFFLASLLVNRIQIPQSQQQIPAYLAVGPEPTPTPKPLASPAEKPFAVALRAGSDDRPTSGCTPYGLFLEAELRDRPNLEGARQCLELNRIYYGDPGRNVMFRFYFSDYHQKALWQAGTPVSGEADQWLKTHSDIVAKFLNLAEGPGPPIRPMKLIAQIEDPDSMPTMGFFMRIGVAILAGEGQRLFQVGDLAGADCYWRASIRLSVICGLEPDYSGMYSVLIPIACLKDRINAEIDRDALLEYRAALASAHALLFPADGHREWLAWRIAARRKRLIADLDHPWFNPAFGWDVDNPDHYGDLHFSLSGLEIPRFDRLAINAASAMQIKEQSTRIIRDFDATYSEILWRATATWPELAARKPFQPPEPPGQIRERFYDRLFFESKYEDVREPVTKKPYYAVSNYVHFYYWGRESWNAQAETRLNLTRAAIECRLTTETQVAKIIPKQIDRESPWRDPFTEKPLGVMDGTSNTLTIYSLGPDMQDQRAAVTYDPTNGTISPGDIHIDLKREPR
ncbi:MAG: hypothetical protein ABFD69_07215 [Candidatus Sumerlaeia bacterium]